MPGDHDQVKHQAFCFDCKIKFLEKQYSTGGEIWEDGIFEPDDTGCCVSGEERRHAQNQPERAETDSNDGRVEIA